ncbi:VanZ family protein [Paenibacillus sp. TRM 82003]|nr:VanZ family protein [Paenibacillus sp. TRM 82003]
MRRKMIWWALVVLWCGFIFAATASPAATGDSTQGLIQRVIDLPAEQAERLNLIIRKSTHAVVFGVLAALLFMALGASRRSYFAAWVLATFYGGVDEFHQSLVPNRGPSLVDVGIDSFGAAVVLAVIYFVSTGKRSSG